MLLFEYAPDMYFICDENGVLIDANRAAEKLTGSEGSSSRETPADKAIASNLLRPFRLNSL